jgi:hypothetical protein
MANAINNHLQVRAGAGHKNGNHLQVRAGAGHNHGKRHQQSPPGESRGWQEPWFLPVLANTILQLIAGESGWPSLWQIANAIKILVENKDRGNRGKGHTSKQLSAKVKSRLGIRVQ